jgi:uroporphyrinogen-III synthase
VSGVAAAVEALGGAGAVVFTGATSVASSLEALARAGRDARSLAGLTLVGIGRETVAALRRAGLRCDLPLRSYLPIRVAAALARRHGTLDGLPVLLVRDGQEGSALGEGLAAAGARVAPLQLATRAIDGRGRQPLDRVMAAGRLDAVVLPSSSAAEALVAGGLTVPPSVPVIAIGPATAAAAARLGLPEAHVTKGSGERGLVGELLRRFASQGPSSGSAPRQSASSDG